MQRDHLPILGGSQAQRIWCVVYCTHVYYTHIMTYIPEPVSVLFIAIQYVISIIYSHMTNLRMAFFLLYNQNYSKIHNHHKIYIYSDILNNLYIRWPVEIKWNDQYIVLVLAIRVPRQYCYAITYNMCVGGVYISIRV